jgi:hypothetical protein
MRGPARDKIAYHRINWSNFGPVLYDLKKQSTVLKIVHK